MVQLAVVRVIFRDDTARSIAVPAVFTGDTAAIDAANFVRRLVTGVKIGGPDRTEYQVVPVGMGGEGRGALVLEETTETKLRKSIPEAEQSGVHRKATLRVAELSYSNKRAG